MNLSSSASARVGSTSASSRNEPEKRDREVMKMAAGFEFKASAAASKIGTALFNFASAQARLMRKFSNDAGLFSGQPRVLTILTDKGGCTLSELSELTGTGMPSLSVSVRNMKKNGLIADDGKRSRNKRLCPTEEGVEKATAFHEEYDAFIAGLEAHFGAERIAEIADTLSEMAEFFADAAGADE